MKFLPVLLTNILFLLAVAAQDTEYTFLELQAFRIFKQLYAKNYSNSVLETKALKGFIRNLREIYAQNEKFRRGESSFKVAIWDKTDTDDFEFKVKHTGYVSVPSFRAYGEIFPYNPNLPINLNYVSQGLVSRVQDQGTCGSCWAFAATGAFEAQLARKTGIMRPMSQQNLIDCNRDDEFGNFGCWGGNPILAYDYLRDVGINSLASYPYNGLDTNMCRFNASSSLGKIIDFNEVQRNNETALMYALHKAGGPIAVAVYSSHATFYNYQSGIYDYAGCIGAPDHAMLLVGYGVNTSFNPPKSYWILKNSWSEYWGESGYMRLAKDAGNLCSIAYEGSYPIIP